MRLPISGYLAAISFILTAMVSSPFLAKNMSFCNTPCQALIFRGYTWKLPKHSHLLIIFVSLTKVCVWSSQRSVRWPAESVHQPSADRGIAPSGWCYWTRRSWRSRSWESLCTSPVASPDTCSCRCTGIPAQYPHSHPQYWQWLRWAWASIIIRTTIEKFCNVAVSTVVN